MKLSVFDFDSYKKFLKQVIKSSIKTYGMTSKLADAGGCQRSYLSQVLNGPIHLTPDHGYGICQYLRLNENETDYFLLLLESERASQISFKKRIQFKIEQMKRDHHNISKRVTAKVVETSESMNKYYSSWYWMAIHLISGITKYQTTYSIAKRLEISEELTELILKELEKMNLVESHSKGWRYKGEGLHLSAQSASSILCHNNWRQKALLDAALFRDKSIHYSSVFTLSYNDIDVLRGRILEWIDEARKIVGPSKSEEIVCFNIDFFEI